MSKQKVVVGMSGGVDSSVTAWLLKERGYEVIGLFMKNWEDDDDSEYCAAREDWIDVVSVADLIGIDVEVVNFAAEYRDRVFIEFLREYAAGRTPNPDVLCNAEIKFKAFLDHAMSLGAQRIATGHYARIREHDGCFELLRAKDYMKDQSYFLYRINQVQLSKTIFPLGDIPKVKVREIAAQIGLPNAKKKDSTGICFIGKRSFRKFLNRYLSTKPGQMKTPDGKVVGQHIGLAFYTCGQRKGIGLSTSHNSNGEPWFVAGKDILSNALYVVQGHNHPWLFSRSLQASNVSWVTGDSPAEGYAGSGKIRYRQAEAACVFHVMPEPGNSNFELCFNEAQWAVTLGQSAVLYDGDVCLGGGIIEYVETAHTTLRGSTIVGTYSVVR